MRSNCMLVDSPLENMADEQNTGGLQCSVTRTELERYGEELRTVLMPNYYDKDLLDDISQGSCCLSNIYNSSADPHARCHLIYYVVGSILYRRLRDDSLFKQTMEKVGELLGSVLQGKSCEMEKSESGKKLFEFMERWSLYNLTHDSTLKEQGANDQISCERYATYLRDLARACAEVKEHCRNSQINDGECVGIAEENDQGSPEHLLGLIYGIIPKFESTLKAEREQEQCLKHLPSNLGYLSLLNVTDKCNISSVLTKETTTKAAIENSLRQYQGTPHYADKIINTWCYANGLGRSTLSGGEHCRYFYFWLGGILSSVRGEVQIFSSLMKAIYDELAKFGINDGCTNIYEHDNIDNIDIFENMKLIYDYSKDHGTIKQYVENPQGAGFSCAKHYSSYLEKVLSAYENMNAECPLQKEGQSNTNKLWCNDLKTMLAQHSYDELLQLKSSLKNISPPSTTDSTAAITGSAVGGTLFTLGLPLAAFLSYKYDLLPSGIRKFFLRGGNGTRMRRTAFEPNSSTEMENFTEYYTENGSTTIDPTEYSTLAGSSSNLTTTSTENSSILYDEDGPSRSPPLPRKKRGRGNNRRGQNISYHSMER
ncbi:KIR protein [Plasmodium knowlesi strain H]|uniref:KIR protein n=3 Tax=Plasmodium knowlesi TaxID=5850 RepID=A0A5K1TZP0_PLAKH|nr:KIR protein [Plasmodium knowlesi strain H]OTN67072.1 KIR protein [Plasmodium knowlesi]CAA9988647.1 KIR protein [Plasmodium knowlesi strain H]SBO21512.1 KIR protein [Plasmodium knowlesi strain H]SBO21921.1 KIR protein [Plasmodium knowlesi strain H]VVS78121.1 KIR protein [Plasmodium knowlesi strain H]|eukprot:XP_002259623.1 KIR protein [Plasmodium knowlesi strain H]